MLLKPIYGGLLSKCAFNFNLRRSNLVAFTGAGMSAESGMPTFRETVAGSLEVDARGRQVTATPLDVLRPLWVGPGGIRFFFCPNSLCLIPQIQPVMLGLCPIMPNCADNFPKIEVMPAYSTWP